MRSRPCLRLRPGEVQFVGATRRETGEHGVVVPVTLGSDPGPGVKLAAVGVAAPRVELDRVAVRHPRVEVVDAREAALEDAPVVARRVALRGAVGLDLAVDDDPDLALVDEALRLHREGRAGGRDPGRGRRGRRRRAPRRRRGRPGRRHGDGDRRRGEPDGAASQALIGRSGSRSRCQRGTSEAVKPGACASDSWGRSTA